MAGDVWVNGQRLIKAGTLVHEDVTIRITGKEIPYVSRGGLKLEAALRKFKIDVTGLRCLDVGASTGGFTDCLLQHGATRVTAVDVGYGQLHWKLRSDPRVTVIERTNVRHLSARAVLPFVKRPGYIICLIKPQFEVGKRLVGKGGVVRDRTLHKLVIEDLGRTFTHMGLHQLGVIPSPILGPKGNQEYLAYLATDPSQ
jgi:23S rRNA (cytidine1920-2'-O)/16S rRNA (cytidine1409-2'-O)-methyltransferase